MHDEYYSDGYYDVDEFGTIMHFGVGPDSFPPPPGRGSGRYPKGSGENSNQHDPFMRTYNKLKEDGVGESDIAKILGYSDVMDMRRAVLDHDNEPLHLKYNRMGGQKNIEALAKEWGYKSGSQLRKDVTISSEIYKEYERQQQYRLKEHGYTIDKIAEITGRSGNTIRNNLQKVEDDFKTDNAKVVNFLRDKVNEVGYLDVGRGAELNIPLNAQLGISKDRLARCVKILENEGYEYFNRFLVPNATNPAHKTTYKILAKPGTTFDDVVHNREKIQSIVDYSQDNGKTFFGIEYPAAVSKSRVKVVWPDEGGAAEDGTILLRRGVPDLDLKNSHYAQVRINIDNTHYLKGMAMYADDSKFPPGVDILFNTSKPRGTAIYGVGKEKSVTKQLKDDPNNPFGAVIKFKDGQYHYTDADGKDRLGAINVIRSEGEWGDWSNTLSAQFLSKQNIGLIRNQLELSKRDHYADFEEAKSVTVPALRKKMLEDFAESCDYDAAHLRAAKFQGQAMQVLLPVPELKDNECFAPRFKNGEQVALVRFPHAGIFEIPILTVNNDQPDGVDRIGRNAQDAVGVNAHTLAQLSGADTDGDTVMVIPLRDGLHIDHRPYLEELKNFDPHEEYKDTGRPGMKYIAHDNYDGTGLEMGKITNLIMDMTYQGATDDEIVRAVKHSMVVIDAKKHKLDYTRSYQENRIGELHKKYQGSTQGGAATIITRAKREKRNEPAIKRYDVDPNTGEQIPVPEPKRISKKTGELYQPTMKIPTMDTVKDARELMRGYDKNNPDGPYDEKEEAYASFANYCKKLANEARLEALRTEVPPPNKSAAAIYANEIASLKAKLEEAQRNAPRERMAQLRASYVIYQQKQNDPTLYNNPKELKKVSSQALAQARDVFGAHKQDVMVNITPKEWEAINAGAVGKQMLSDIFLNTNMDKVREYAIPNNSNVLSTGKQDRIDAMVAAGKTISDISDATGISASTISRYLRGQR